MFIRLQWLDRINSMSIPCHFVTPGFWLIPVYVIGFSYKESCYHNLVIRLQWSTSIGSCILQYPFAPCLTNNIVNPTIHRFLSITVSWRVVFQPASTCSEVCARVLKCCVTNKKGHFLQQSSTDFRHYCSWFLHKTFQRELKHLMLVPPQSVFRP